MKGVKKYTWSILDKYTIEKEPHSLRLDRVCRAEEDNSQIKTFTVGWFHDYVGVATKLLQLNMMGVEDVSEIKSAMKKAVETTTKQLAQLM